MFNKTFVSLYMYVMTIFKPCGKEKYSSTNITKVGLKIQDRSYQ